MSLAGCSGINILKDKTFVPCVEYVVITPSAGDIVTYSTFKQITDSLAVYEELCE